MMSSTKKKQIFRTFDDVWTMSNGGKGKWSLSSFRRLFSPSRLLKCFLPLFPCERSWSHLGLFTRVSLTFFPPLSWWFTALTDITVLLQTNITILLLLLRGLEDNDKNQHLQVNHSRCTGNLLVSKRKKKKQKFLYFFLFAQSKITKKTLFVFSQAFLFFLYFCVKI